MSHKQVLGVDLGGTNISVGRVEEMKISRLFTRSISAHGSEKQILDEVIQAIKSAFDQEVAAIGLGVPSLVDVEKGIVYDVQNIPSWKKVHLKEILENIFHRPVYVNNDANCFALGEKHFGKGKRFKNLVGLTVGTGLGAGIIIDNRLYAGTNCGAGEVGSILYKEHIYEYYCSGQFFKNFYNVAGSQVFENAKKGDKKSLEIFEEFGVHFGNAIKTVLFAFDPEAIILGGSVSRSYPFFKKSMWQEIVTFPYRHVLESLVIDISEEAHISILGAAALYFDALGMVQDNLFY